MNDNGTATIKLQYDFPDEDNARAAYGSAMTAIQMFRSLGNNTPRFRAAYPETFTAAELEYMSETDATPSQAAEWTHEMLEQYMGIVQMCLFPLASALADMLGEQAPDKDWLLNPNIQRGGYKDMGDMTQEEVMAAIDNILKSNNSEGGIQ